MAVCATCGNYYRLTVYNETEVCDECLAPEDIYEEIDDDMQVEIFNIKNPSGRVPAKFNEVDSEEDSFGL
jgi:hypothetical protein